MNLRIKLIMVTIYVVILNFTILGCQQSPDLNIVADKSNLENTIANKSTNKQEAYDINNDTIIQENDNLLWKHVYEDHIFTVDVDAVLSIPDVKLFPVIKIRSLPFTNKHLNKIVDTFFGDKTIYDGNIALTKEELEQAIIQQKVQIYNAEESGWSGAVVSEEYLNILEEAYQSAPEKIELQKVKAGWIKLEDGSQQVNLLIESDNGLYERIEGYSSDTKSTIKYIKGIPSYRIESDLKEQPNGVILKKNEAELMATNAINQLGLKNMQMSGSFIAKDYFEQYEKECYVFCFTRSIDGIPSTYVHISKDVSDSEELLYAPHVPEEIIRIFIDDSGIVKFIWENVYEEIEYISKNVELLDMAKIQEIFLYQMKLYGEGRNKIYSFNNMNIVNESTRINRVTLGMMSIIDKDKDTYLLIPVWDFFGTSNIEYSDGAIEERYNSGGYEIDYCIMTINAIDGSIINRSKGY